jgi:uridylate kinase
VKDRDLGTTRLGATEVRDRGDSPVDALVLDLMANAKHVREIHVVNGRDRGALTDAVNGKPAGTVISA